MKALSLPLIALSLFGVLAAPAQAHFETGQIYVVDYYNSTGYFINPDTWNVNLILDSTDGLAGPGSIGFTFHGHMLIPNYDNDTVLELDEDLNGGVVLTSADGINGPYGATGAIIGPGHGDVYLSNFDGSEILKFDEDYNPEGVFVDAADGVVRPDGVAFMADGHLLVANRGSGGEILHVDPTGITTVWATLGGQNPVDIMIRNNYDVYVLTMSGRIYRFAGGSPIGGSVIGSYNGGAGNLNGAMAFNPDHSVIYHLNQNGSLRTIDPDTGVDTVVATIPGSPTSLAVVGTQYAPGTYIEFGDSFPGTGGIGPTAHGDGEPRINQSTQIDLHDFIGGALVFAFIGIGMDENIVQGAEFHIDVSQFYRLLLFNSGGATGVAGDGDLDLITTIPNDPLLVYSQWYIQAAAVDAGAAQGYSFTNCLQMYIGE